jgi:uncharacterized HAD superfamily protein
VTERSEVVAQIGVDIDGIIADTDTAFRRRMSEVFKRNFPRYLVKDFHYENCFKFSQKEMIIFCNLFLDKELWKNIKLIRGARPTLRKLKAHHSLIIITGRPIEVRDVTLEWLESRRIPFDKLYFMQGRQKHEIARLNRHKFSLFLEDHPSYALKMAQDGVKVLLMDYPWNQKIEGHPNIVRVKNWRQINRILKESNLL